MTFAPQLLTAFGLVPTLAVAALCVSRPALFQRLELTVYDVVVRATPVRPPGDRVVIVDVDDKSLDAIGQWPWRRDVVGALVSKLRDGGAAVVALDIIFAERDRAELSPATVSYSWPSPRSSPDAAFAEALRPGSVVLGYGMRFEPGAGGSRRCVQHPLAVAVLQREDHSSLPYFTATGAVCSLPELAEAAGASGFLNAAPDPDGILRRAPLLMEFAGHVYPSLGVAAVTAMEKARDVTLRVENANTSILMAATAGAEPAPLAVPLDGRSNLLLRYRGKKRTFDYVSAVDVLRNRAPAGTFTDKLVLVGTTALGTREVVSTPLDTLFTGVEVQATIADNLLQRDFISRPSAGVLVETLVVVLLGAIATLLVTRYGLTWGAAAGAGALPAAWTASVGLLSVHGLFVSPLYPSLALFLVLGSTALAGFTLERRRADREGREKVASKRLMVQTLLSLTEIRDTETGKHSRRTQQFTRVLAQELARNPGYARYLTPERIDLLSTLAPLHDIGKVGVPDSVLNKPGKLTPEELAEMRRHPVYGRDVIVKAEQATGVRDDVTLAMAKDIVYTHHEKWDGTGYPEGLSGEGIPIPGRVMAVVDVYDACTTRTLYTASLSQDATVALIVKGRGTHFDPAVVDAFLVVAPILRSLSEAAQQEEQPD
jgi:CHASE2 domain-containing sensor protein